MKKKEVCEKRICNFYVNDWHLTTMMLPYIDKQIKNDTKIITVLERGIDDKVKELLEKINLKEETKKKISLIKWTSTKISKYSELEEYVLRNIADIKNIDIIIKGENDYIDLANKEISKIIKCNLDSINVNIINCYEVNELNNVKEIVKKHNMILNTSGLRKVEEVFTECRKVSNE